MPLFLNGLLQVFRDTDRTTLEHADAVSTIGEHHHHSNECWWAAAASPSGETHVADRVVDQDTTTAFQLDGGSSQWGAWVQILGSEDMPCEAEHTMYDFHRIIVTTVERANAIHWLQFAFGAEPTDGAASGTYTTVPYYPASAASRAAPVEIQSKRYANATKVWARLLVVGQATGTLNFYAGTHGYVE